MVELNVLTSQRPGTLSPSGTPTSVDRRGPIRCRIATQVADVDASEWQRVCGGADEALMDLRFLAAVEASTGRDNRFWYLLFYDEGDEPVAAACASQFVLDAALLTGPWFRWAIGWTRRLLPRYLKFRVVFCGLPVSTGGSHLRILPGADAAAVVAALDEQLLAIARREGAWPIAVKEFSDEECVVADGLGERGYLKVASLPMNTFRHRFADWDSFLAAIRSHYRYKINRSRKKFTKAGLVVEHVTEAARMIALYTPEVHEYYVNVVNRAEHKLEILPRGFFLELAARFAPHVSLTTVRQRDRVVAFGWGLKCGSVYRNTFIGVDPALNEEADLYFNVMMADLDFALRSGAEEILVGQTADVFKSRLGCEPERRWFYVKCTSGWLNWSLRATAPWLFPPYQSPPKRDLFKPDNASE